MDRWVTAVDRRLGVEGRLEEFVGHHDRLERSTAGFGMIRGNHGDRLAHVPDDVGHEHGLVLADQTVGHLAGDVVGGDHGLHAIDLPHGAEVDRDDPGVRMR